jgi:small conductance mechanosensitive channel
VVVELNLEFLYPLITFVGILIATWVIARFLSTLLGRLLKHVTPLVAVQARRLAWALIWLLGIVLALEQVGLRVDLLLLLIGLLGAVLVVANAETLRNIASKYFSDVYLPLKVGDSIKVREYSGKVIEINPMSTILLTDNEELISIPNSIFLREPVLNTTPHAWKEVTVPIVISSEIDLAQFESEVLRSCNKLKLHLDERFPPILTVRNRDQRSMDLVLTLMVKEPSRKEAIISDISSRVAEIVERMQREMR